MNQPTKTWPLTLLLAVSIGLAGWNLRETHVNGSEISALRQMVCDGKELRLKYQADNDADHTKYELALKQLEKDILELRLRVTTLEKTRT